MLSAVFLHYSILDGLIISHLPDGPTARFRVSNVVFAKEIKVYNIRRNVSSL